VQVLTNYGGVLTNGNAIETLPIDQTLTIFKEQRAFRWQTLRAAPPGRAAQGLTSDSSSMPPPRYAALCTLEHRPLERVALPFGHRGLPPTNLPDRVGANFHTQENSR
jgi:hypothetical protein